MSHATVRTLTQSPEQLIDELFTIFPKYKALYNGPIHDEKPTYHSVLLGFTPFFSAELTSFSQKQLRSFGDLISAAVTKAGPLENAFETCLLEHFHQIRASRVLHPYLSKIAREKTHA